ncbi:sialoadhesin-like isoform X2 [Danio aesculapii]|uniref:sialoadhesin-like isoform X2 n=1 Tax=Danio aesculapii TaxID=1142201 RepID=UPI0024BF9B4D|nr:sialoadhesin-like isoform X2 [Danio aesculapii]
MDFRLLLLILLLHISGSLTLDRLSVTCENICALRETSVQLKCAYDSIPIKSVFWFSWKQSPNWRKNNEPEDLDLDSDYSGRVKQIFKHDCSTLLISDVTERDSGEYQLMFIMKDGVKCLSSVAVSLTVTDLQVKMSPASTDTRGPAVNLTCDTSCDLTFKPKDYFWKKNGQYIKDLHARNITVASTEMDGSYSCFLTQDLKNSSSPVCVSKSGCWDVSYTSRRVCALVNSTVDISCTYSHPSDYTVKKTFWHYSQTGNFMGDLLEEHQFAGRVEFVENKLRIKELKISDSGEYQFKIITDKTGGTYSGSPGVILTVTDTEVISRPDTVSEGEKVILSCSTKCTLSSKHTYIWYKNGQQVTDGFTKDNKLYLDSVSSEELQEFSCAVGEAVDSTAVSHYTVTLLVFVPQFLILAAVWMWFFIRAHLISKTENKDEVEKSSI